MSDNRMDRFMAEADDIIIVSLPQEGSEPGDGSHPSKESSVGGSED